MVAFKPPVFCTVKVALRRSDVGEERLPPSPSKPVPLAEACVILGVTGAALVGISDWVWVGPICTLPKLSVVGATVSLAPLSAPGETTLTPWQPSMVTSASRATIVLSHLEMRFIGGTALYRPVCFLNRSVCAPGRNLERFRKGILGRGERPIL